MGRTPCRTRCFPAWRALPQFDGRSSLRTWLHTIATNVGLDAIARRPKRVLGLDAELA
jgi:RNA polymerase sigma-70 factor, ECF subfamily